MARVVASKLAAGAMIASFMVLDSTGSNLLKGCRNKNLARGSSTNESVSYPRNETGTDFLLYKGLK